MKNPRFLTCLALVTLINLTATFCFEIEQYLLGFVALGMWIPIFLVFVDFEKLKKLGK